MGNAPVYSSQICVILYVTQLIRKQRFMDDRRAIVRGTVVKGDGVASRDYNLPTANLDVKEPGIDTGVYAAHVRYKDQPYKAIVCYGVGNPAKFEVHLFDFDGDLTGEELTVGLIDKVSELIPWQSKERMRQKILHDIQLVREYLDKLPE